MDHGNQSQEHQLNLIGVYNQELNVNLTGRTVVTASQVEEYQDTVNHQLEPFQEEALEQGQFQDTGQYLELTPEGHCSLRERSHRKGRINGVDNRKPARVVMDNKDLGIHLVQDNITLQVTVHSINTLVEDFKRLVPGTSRIKVVHFTDNLRYLQL